MSLNLELEKEIEHYLVQTVRNVGGYCLKWVCPGWSGVPDRMILLPCGRVAFVEVKRPKGGEMAKRQEAWAKKLRRLGFMVYTVATKDEARWVISEILRISGGPTNDN